MSEEPKGRISALAMTRRSEDYATVALTADDVRRFRPAWSVAKARHFLEEHQAELAHTMLEFGVRVLEMLIEQHEKESGYE